MFEREIKFIYDFNLNKVNRLGPYFTFEQLLASDIHPAILQYISAEIDYLIYEDRQKLLKNSLFDYSGEKISFHFNQISEEVKKSKRFAQEYIAKLILHASSFTINYLARPKWTLTKFVFDEENIKSTNDIKQILNYVYYYKYVNKILISYINSKKILSMNSNEFEDLLNKADKLGVEAYLPSILENALKSMGEFFNIGEIQKTKIPLAAVEMFLEEKELFKHLQKAGEIFGGEEGVKFNIADYQKVFKNIIQEKEELIPEPEEQAVPDIVVEEKLEKEPEHLSELESEHAGLEEIKEKIVERAVDEPVYEAKESDADENYEEDETEEDELPDQEIIIAPPLKFRIKINEDSRIEPVSGENGEEITGEMENDDEDEQSYEPEDEEILENKPDEIELDEDESASDSNESKTNFQEELNLAKMNFEEIDEDDKSFLQSLHDENETPASKDQELEEDESSDRSVEEFANQANDTAESGIGRKESEWPFYLADKRDTVSDSGDNSESDQQTGMDMTEILEHKEMTKIIEVIFDYDIEDFANTLDEITNCKNEDDAHVVINETLRNRHVSRESKEAEVFRSIISEYFNKK
ncbi:MAG: hypothetical protein WC061_06365 [Melioribacteraceae bacterium]